MPEQDLSNSSSASPFKALAIVVIAPLIAFAVLDTHQAVFAVFLTAMLLWFTEALPLPVTALFIPISISVFGLLPPGDAFGPFGADILYLFLGCFLMGLSMAKYGFDRRVAYWLLSRCLPGESLFAVNVVIAGASFFLSMWVSNTAAAAIMSTVTLGVLDSLGRKIQDKALLQAVGIRFLLSVAFASSIGGLATPIGSPPNVIALKYLVNHGIAISFLQWMAFGLPVALLMLLVLFVIFERRYPIRGVRLENVKNDFATALAGLGSWKTGEKQIAVVFVCTICLWILPDILVALFPEVAWIKEGASRISMSVIGLLGGIATFFLPVRYGEKVTTNLEWHDTTQVDWGTILLFGGGLALGNLLEQSGAAKAFGEVVFQSGVVNLYSLVGTIIVVSILLSEFASNTAAAAILVPLVIGAANSMGVSSEVLQALVLCVAFSASFGFMLPVSTPPNAIVFGTGRVPSKEMRRSGVWFDLCGGLIIAGFITALLSFF